MQPKAEDFTEQAWAVFISAQAIAKQRSHQQIESEHILLALIDQNGLVVDIINQCGASIISLK